MSSSSVVVSPALKALLAGLIDYAGTFPPASLPLGKAAENYRSYERDRYSWMLRSFVTTSSELDKLPNSMNGHLAILGESDNARAASIESKEIVRDSSHPVYCEVPLSELSKLDAVASAGNFAKIRTGGVKPDAIPSPVEVAGFIDACAQRRLPFKATAGLHHPVRAEQSLTYEAAAPRAVMHGFLNVALAAAFRWHGERDIVGILSETDASAFWFDSGAHWRDKKLTEAQIKDARTNFFHSIGSCSFEEPVQELQALALL